MFTRKGEQLGSVLHKESRPEPAESKSAETTDEKATAKKAPAKKATAKKEGEG